MKELTTSRKERPVDLNFILSEVLAHTHIMAVFLDPQFNFVWVNNAYAATCRHDVSFFLGKNHFDLYPHTENKAIFKRVVETGEPFFVQAKAFEFPDQPDRGMTYWDWSLIPTKDDTGAVTGLVFTLAEVTDRVKVEEELRRSEKKFRTLHQMSPVAIVLNRLDNGQFIESNEALWAMTGYSEKEYRSLTYWDITPADYAEMESKQLELLRTVGKYGPYEKEYIRKGGKRIPVLLNGVRIQDSQGNDLIYSVIQDISELKRKEQAVREKESLLSETQSIAHIGSWTVALPTMKTTLSEEAYRIFGVRPDTFTPSPESFLGLIHTEDRAAMEKWIEECMTGKNPPELEFRIVRPDGTIRQLCGRGYLQSNPDDQTLRMIGSVQDITERKEAALILREKTAMAQTLMDAMPCVALLLKKQSREIIALNKAAREAGAELGGTCYGSWPKSDKACSFCKAPDAWSTDKSQILEVEAVGTYWEAHWVPVTDDLYLHYALDITERKRSERERIEMQERINRSEKMEALGHLAGGVAHDLNNVLGVTMAYAEIMKEKTEAGSQLRKCADSIFTSTEKAAAMIQDLLTLARRGVPVSEVVDLNHMVSNVLKSAEYNVLRDFHPRVDFRAILDREPLLISGSQIHLEKTVLNLISNAAESISGRGDVTIGTERQYLDKPIHGYDEVREGEYAVLTVKDTGGGIRPEDLGRIFEPFFTRKKMGRSGTGLGLAIAWGTVKDHEGYIDVESEPGKGTAFSLYFPVTKEKKRENDQGVIPVERYLGDGESVLVVDDVAGQREIAVEILTQLRYEVKTASCGEEAVEYLKQNSADIVILDMIMDPGMDGLDTYRAILTVNPKQKAIIVSGFSETERVKEALRLGAGAYVKKPYLRGRIGIALRRELERA